MPLQNSPFDSSDSESVIDRQPLMVNPQTSVGETIALMNQTQSSCALVVETLAEKPTLLGIFTEQDVVRLVASEQLGKCRRSKITRVMNASPIVISPAQTEDILSVYQRLCEHQIRHLPVVDVQNRLLGLITQESLLRVLNQSCSDSPRNISLSNKAQTTNRPLIPTLIESAGVSSNEGARFRSLIENRLLDIIHCDTQAIIKTQTQQAQVPQSLLPPIEEEPAQLNQQRLEAELAEELIFLQASLLDQVRSAVIATDKAGNIIYWNKFAEQLYQWPAAEVIGKSVLEILCLDTNKALAEEILNSLMQNGQWEGEFTVQRQDRTSFVALVRDAVIKNQMGEVIGVVGISVDITQRKQMEEALRQSEERFRRLVDTMNEGLIICDANGLITYVNEKFGAMLGYSPTAMLGRHILNFPYKDNQEILQEEIAKRQRGESSSYELELTRKDGQKLFVLVSSTPILDADCQFQGAFAVFTDITDRKRYEEQLKNYQNDLEALVQLRTDEKTKVISQLQSTNEQLKQEIAYRELIVSSLQASQRFIQRINDATPHVVYLYDLIEDCNIYVNQQFTELLGYPTTAFQTAAAKFLQEKMHPDDWLAMQQLHQQTLNAENGDVVEGEYRLQHANGEWRWFRSRQVIFTRDSAGVVQQILGTSADITERKLAEAALQESEERYRLLAENATDMIARYSPEGICLYVSPACQLLLGYEPEELIGHWAYEFFHPEDTDKIASAHSHLLESGQVHTISYRIIRKDHRYIWFETTSRAVCNPQTGETIAIMTVSRDVTERKRSEEALRQSEERLESILNSLQDVVWSVAMDTNELVYLNPIAETVFGRSLAEFFAHPQLWLEIVHPEDRQRVEQFAQAILRTGSQEIEYRIVWPNGEVRWLRNRARIAYNATGHTLRLDGLATDITEHKRSEEALQQSEERFRQLAASINQVFWIASLDWQQMLYISPAYEAIWNRPCAELYEQPLSWLDSVHPEDKERVRSLILKQSQEWEEYTLEYRIIRSDDSIRWILSSSFFIKNEQGDVYRRSAVAIDITERKQMEEALQFTQQQLQHLLASSPAIIYSAGTSANYGTNFISENVNALLGYEPDEFTEDAKFWIQHIHPEDVETVLATMPVLFEQRHHTNEYRFLRKDGSYRWMRDEMRLICDAGGNPVEFVGYWADITTQKAAEEEIYKALAQEKELSELRSRFITLTSHEFRTPLCTILSSADLLEFYLEQESTQRYLEHIQRIQLAAVHMTQMLNDILLIGKSDAEKLECNPVPLNLELFCRQLVEEVLASNSVHRQHSITLRSYGCSANACMDETLLRHIFTNLLSNAIKYSDCIQPINFEFIYPKEEFTLNNEAWETSTQEILTSHLLMFNSPVVIFRIKDRGIGIPLEDQQRVFESFYRGSNLHNQPGRGLGLAIVKKSVEAHGGQVFLESHIGAGTTFTVILPLQSSTVAELATTSEHMS